MAKITNIFIKNYMMENFIQNLISRIETKKTGKAPSPDNLNEENWETFLKMLADSKLKAATPEIEKTIGELSARLRNFVNDASAGEKLLTMIKEYKYLDVQTGVLDENIGNYLHDETIARYHGELEGLSGTAKRSLVNALRIKEILESIYSNENADINDLDFVTDILAKEKNKFVRNLSLKKSAEVFNKFNQYDVVYYEGWELRPSVTDLYAELFRNSKNKLPKRDFLYILPLIIKDNRVDVELLKTVMEIQESNKFRGGTASENLLFTALVDLYDNQSSYQLSKLLEIAAKDFKIVDKRGDALTDQNEEKYSNSCQLLVKYGDPKEYQQIMQLAPEDQAEFFIAYIENLNKDKAKLAEFMKKIPDEQKKKLDTLQYEFLNDMYAKIEQGAFQLEGVLKKLSAIKLLSPVRFRETLTFDYESLKDLNKAVDKAQIELFTSNFQVSEYDSEIMKEEFGVNLPPDNLQHLMPNILEVYKSWGNFNSLLILMNRYNKLFLLINEKFGREYIKETQDTSFDILLPKKARNYQTLLLKELAYHVMSGDFKEWRNTIERSLRGIEMKYLNQESDLPFWQKWVEDDQTSKFESPFEFNLQQSMIEADKSFVSLFNNPGDYFFRPELWKNGNNNENFEFINKLVKNKKGKSLADPSEIQNNVEQFMRLVNVLESNQIDDETRNQLKDLYNITVNDKAKIGRFKKMVKGLGALLKLYEMIKQRSLTKLEFNSESELDVLKFRNLLDDINIEVFLKTPKELGLEMAGKTLNKTAGELCGRTFYFLKELKQMLEHVKKIKLNRDDNKLKVIDSSDPLDLLNVGQESSNIINCMSFQGSPNKNLFVMDIASSKTKKVLLVKSGDKVLARAVLKILRSDETNEAPPVIIVDDLLVETKVYDYKAEIREHLMNKFKALPQVLIGEGIPDVDEKFENFRKILQLIRRYGSKTETLLNNRRRELLSNHEFHEYNYKDLDDDMLKKLMHDLSEAETVDEAETIIKKISDENLMQLSYYLQKIILGHSTWSRIDGELVEIPRKGKPTPYIYQQNPKKDIFYSHFVYRY